MLKKKTDFMKSIVATAWLGATNMVYSDVTRTRKVQLHMKDKWQIGFYNKYIVQEEGKGWRALLPHPPTCCARASQLSESSELSESEQLPEVGINYDNRQGKK